MFKVLLKVLGAILLVGTTVQSATADAGGPKEQSSDLSVHAVMLLTSPLAGGEEAWFSAVSDESRPDVAPPMTLAIIACRIDQTSPTGASAAGDWREVEWHMPVECMRVVETVTDAAALSNLWLRQLAPNLADYGTCAEVSMTYAPTWEAAHKSWAVVKIGCPTKIVDDAGNIIGWHMPECRGTLPGTTYPLRCRFDPSEI
jgi:hypothetical protein